MTLRTIAILSPGDMGHGVGKALSEHGYDVITCLAGRSQRTKDLAAAGGFRDTESLDEMVSQADLIMSILGPGRSRGRRRRVSPTRCGPPDSRAHSRTATPSRPRPRGGWNP